MLAIGLARAQQRVDLVDEYHRRLAAPRHREQRADHLLALANPLARQTRCGDAEKRRPALTRHGSSDQSLTRPRRTEQE